MPKTEELKHRGQSITNPAPPARAGWYLATVGLKLEQPPPIPGNFRVFYRACDVTFSLTDQRDWRAWKAIGNILKSTRNDELGL